jgi:hypothetical protein
MPALGRTARLLALLVPFVALAAPAAAVTTEEFKLRTGADLVALCETPKDDPHWSAAIHMCHGFGVGVYQTLMALTTHEKLTPVLCPPNPAPTRNESLGRFLEWAKTNPQRLGEAPAEVVGRFLVETYPCPKTAKAPK